jgi:hypothetical protein
MKLPQRKYVYVFNVRPVGDLIPFLWIAKVGISGDDAIRAADVERSILQELGLQVRVSRFFRARVFMFRGIEKALHGVLKPYNSKRFRGSNGGTEYFTVLNVFTGLVSYILAWGAGIPCAGWLAAVIMLLPLPLDFALFAALLAAVEYTLAGLVVYAAYFLLTVISQA